MLIASKKSKLIYLTKLFFKLKELFSFTQVYGEYLGDVRCGVPGHLHRQPSRLHDHQGGVPRPVGGGRQQGQCIEIVH